MKYLGINLTKYIQDLYEESLSVSIVSLSVCHEVMGSDVMILVFLNV